MNQPQHYVINSPSMPLAPSAPYGYGMAPQPPIGWQQARPPQMYLPQQPPQGIPPSHQQQVTGVNGPQSARGPTILSMQRPQQ
jgi:hypothetical protein